MTPITCLRSFRQAEEKLKFITIPEKFHRYIDDDDLICFRDACDDVLQKKKKQAVSTLCMIETWLVYKTLKKYFDKVVKSNNCELPIAEKENLHSFAEFNPVIEK